MCVQHETKKLMLLCVLLSLFLTRPTFRDRFQTKDQLSGADCWVTQGRSASACKEWKSM